MEYSIKILSDELKRIREHLNATGNRDEHEKQLMEDLTRALSMLID